jgi:hypothetical protein
VKHQISSNIYHRMDEYIAEEGIRLHEESISVT